MHGHKRLTRIFANSDYSRAKHVKLNLVMIPPQYHDILRKARSILPNLLIQLIKHLTKFTILLSSKIPKLKFVPTDSTSTIVGELIAKNLSFTKIIRKIGEYEALIISLRGDLKNADSIAKILRETLKYYARVNGLRTLILLVLANFTLNSHPLATIREIELTIQAIKLLEYTNDLLQFLISIRRILFPIHPKTILLIKDHYFITTHKRYQNVPYTDDESSHRIMSNRIQHYQMFPRFMIDA